MKRFAPYPSLLLGLALACLASFGRARGLQDEAPTEPTPAEQREDLAEELEAAQLLAEGAAEDSEEAELVRVYQQALGALEGLENAREDREQATEQLAKLLEAPPVAAQPVELEPLPELRGLGFERLEELAAEARARTEEAEAALEAVRARARRQAEEFELLPGLVAGLRSGLDDLANGVPDPGASPQLLEAEARRDALRTAQWQAEISAYEAQREYLAADARFESERAGPLELLAEAWGEREAELEGALQELRLEQARTEAREADLQASSLRNSRFADQAERIADLRSVLVLRQRASDGVSAEVSGVEQSVGLLDKRFEALRDRYENAGRVNSMGPLLRNEARQLDEPGDLRRQVERLQPQIILRSVQLLDAREAKAQLFQGGAPADFGDEDSATAARLYQEELAAWTALIKVLEGLRNNLEDELDARQLLLQRTSDFAAYVNERVLWVQSAAPIWRWTNESAEGAEADGSGAVESLDWLRRDLVAQPVNRVSSLAAALGWLLSPANWGEALGDLRRDLSKHASLWAVLAVGLLGLGLVRRRLFERLDLLVDEGDGPAVAVYRPLVECFGITTLLALPVPLVLGFLGLRLAAAPTSGSLLPVSLGLALPAAALVWFQLAFTRIACRPEGLVPSHLLVPGSIARRIRRRILLFGTALVMSLLVFRTLAAFANQAGGDEEYVNTLGRLALLLLLGLLLAFGVGLRSPRGEEVAESHEEELPEFPRRLANLFRQALIAGSLALGIVAMVGYVYTASELFVRMRLSLGLLGLLILALLVTLRLVEITKRRVASQRVRAQLAAEGAGAGEPPAEADPARPSLSEVSQQARQLLSTFVGIAGALGLYWIWIEVVPALGIFRQVELWRVEDAAGLLGDAAGGDGRSLAVTLADLLLAVFWILIGFVAGKRLPVLLDLLVFERTKLSGGERYAIQAISRYLLTLIGLALGFGALRIGWNDVQFLAAAISVGLGFGLQEIFANFVSGLILLFERPVRIGDWVALDSVTGQVSRIQIRATTVQDFDRRELIVPNKDFVTSRLINYTLTDSITRARVDVGIAYGSDTKLAKRLLIDCAKRTLGVVAVPSAKALFLGFGESSLDFTLFVFIEERERIQDIRSDLHFKIDEAFRKEGVEISFPQRDLHVRTAPGLEHVAELSRLSAAEREALEAGPPQAPEGKGPLA